MSLSPAKIQRPNTLQFRVRYYLAFVLVLAIPCLLSYSAIASLAAGDWLWATFAGVMLLVSFWALPSVIVFVPLTLYLNEHYGERNYTSIDRVYSRALSILNRLPVRRTLSTAGLYSNLGLMRLCQGHYDSAESLFRQAVDYIRKTKRLSEHWYAAILLNNLAATCCRQGNYVESDLLSTEALEILDLPKNAKHAGVKAFVNSCIGAVRFELGEIDSAEEYFNQARKFHETSKVSHSMLPASKLQSETAVNFMLALVHARQGKLSESESDCDRALSIVQQGAAVNTMTLRSLDLLANEYMNNKKFERAETLLELAYAAGSEWPFHPDAQKTLSYYEKLLLLTGRQSEVPDMRSWLRPIRALTRQETLTSKAAQ